MDFTYRLNDTSIVTRVDGEIFYGEPRVLLSEDDDLTAGTPWADQGYVVTKFLAPELHARLREGIQQRIVSVLSDAGIRVSPDFTMETYHVLTAEDERVHPVIVEWFRRGFPLESLPIDYHLVERRIAEIVGVEVTAHNQAYGLDVFNMRVVRPHSNDNNPLHRDVWLDRLRNAVNIYLPLAGSDAKSSLCLVPGSHRWQESEIARTAAGALVNGMPYTVPAVVGAKYPLTLIRPNPAPDEVLLFSPYLIHGGAANLNEGVTRVSLEMRFWRASSDAGK